MPLSRRIAPIRIAMWSGPRNISTAMMRAWDSRADTVVTDEPLYAAYLAATGADHPGRAEVLAAQDHDWRRVVAALAQGPPPADQPVWYQKHMTHHVLPEMPLDWLAGLTNAFLIREPRAVVASYARTRERPAPADLGYDRQAELFDAVARATGRTPPVIDAADVLKDPPRLLSLLCAALDLEFDPAMLSWAPGRRPTDGVWAPYWYGAVERSTGFAPYAERTVTLPPDLEPVAEACQPAYRRLRQARLR